PGGGGGVASPPPRPPAGAGGAAAAAGVLSSAVPFLADMLALRTVPAHFFGVFMSVHPVMAALVGWAVLGQRLPLVDWLAIAAIVAANSAAALAAAPRPARAR
ncbi:EamA family transporter, partial [Kitasatospora sp. NPDC051914]|uniref:EamA family transporter n=1 Tax=Kitasatospora sp. NPDC051914 TaxID=3154945 RepID=UPI00341EF2BE